jgi:hypothetical protein
LVSEAYLIFSLPLKISLAFFLPFDHVKFFWEGKVLALSSCYKIQK